MKSEILKYANLRVYKSLSTLNLLNSMLCNRIMKKPILVNNSRRMYELSTKLFGKSFVNAILTATFCKVLTAGNSLQEANQVSDYFRQHSNDFFTWRYPCYSGLLCRRFTWPRTRIRPALVKYSYVCRISQDTFQSKERNDFDQNYWHD